MQRPALQIARHGRSQLVIRLEPGPLTIGRDPHNDIVLPDDRVADLAAALHVNEAGEVWIRDHSGGQIDWDDRPVDDGEGRLVPGAVLRAGAFELTLKEHLETLPDVVRQTMTRADDQASTGDRVVVKYGGLTHVLDPDHALNIGGRPNNDIVVDDGYVSGHHCRIVYDQGRWLLVDLQSRNGTRLNDVNIEVAELPSTGRIQVGNATLSVSRPAVEPTAEVVELHGLTAASPAMKAIFPRLERFARALDPVLVLGESGVGKELVARALHAASPRASGPFRVVNCATLNTQLSGAELFGHRKGAFTGAANAQAGMFEEASGGTLFLDEIGELPIDVQPTLLRTLETSTVRRIGTSTEVPVDVRIVSATHRQLDVLARDGRFRDDLIFRIKVLTLTIPPLRERPEDIAVLASFFLQSAPEVSLADDALDRLRQHSWPGNVRELRNVIRCALAMREGDVIRGTDIQIDAPSVPAPRITPRRRAALTDNAVRQETIAALEANNGVAAQAARQLGISKSTMHYRMTRYGLL